MQEPWRNARYLLTDNKSSLILYSFVQAVKAIIDHEKKKKLKFEMMISFFLKLFACYLPPYLDKNFTYYPLS